MIQSSNYALNYSAYRVTSDLGGSAPAKSSDGPAPARTPAQAPASFTAEGFQYSLTADRASASYFYVSLQTGPAAAPGSAASPGFGFQPLFDLAAALREFSAGLSGGAAAAVTPTGGTGADAPAPVAPPVDGSGDAPAAAAPALPAPSGEAASPQPSPAVDDGVADDDAPAAAEAAPRQTVGAFELSFTRVVYAALKAPRPGSEVQPSPIDAGAVPAGNDGRTATAASTAPPVAKDAATTAGAGAADAPAEDAATAEQKDRLIERLGVEDFQRFRLKQRSLELTASFSLALTTRDGDQVTLDYSQLDLFERTRFNGRSEDGERIRYGDRTSASERLVQLDVTGELDEGERAAIDELFDKLVDVANGFFQGSLKDAVAELKNLEFDGEELADLALQLGRSQSRSALKAYGDADGIDRVVSRDRAVGAALEYYADGERTLIEAAGERFAQTSAVKLVRTVLPALVSGDLSTADGATGGPAPAELAVAAETAGDDDDRSDD